jgi:hypothetical protein
LENPPLWVWAIIVDAIIASSSIDGNQQKTLLRKSKKREEGEELIVMMIKEKTYLLIQFALDASKVTLFIRSLNVTILYSRAMLALAFSTVFIISFNE